MAFGESQVQPVILSIEQGNKDWATLMVGGPQAVQTFPLKMPLSMAENQCLYFSDRVRWNQAANKPSDEQKAK
jgi:hypothetical protein